MALARSGAEVAISDRRVESLGKTEAMIGPLGRRVLKAAVDVVD